MTRGAVMEVEPNVDSCEADVEMVRPPTAPTATTTTTTIAAPIAQLEWISWSAFTPSVTSGEAGGHQETFERIIGAQAPHLGSRVDICKASTPAHHTPFYLHFIFQFERRCIGVM